MLALLATLYPNWRASRVRPVKALPYADMGISEFCGHRSAFNESVPRLRLLATVIGLSVREQVLLNARATRATR
jgi:hypothetical protein